MHDKVLPPGSRDLLAELESLSAPVLAGWTLAGGTGLALQLGHRVSDDFDLFRTDRFDPDELLGHLQGSGPVELLQLDHRTLTVLASGVKVSFFSVPDPFLFPKLEYSFFALAEVRDIALMKLAAIASRGSRKDFVDLFVILRGGPTLAEYLSWLPRKYGEERVNTYHVLKSLTWFEDAEDEPMPRMLEPFDWDECKAFFVREAHAIVLP
ncbi:MAG TPA: nucleotidyl transferase AbiEii/AbiGii toxin family protein [Methylomirabilota bacterium]|nr:nucleotidyl transferase AbiEii/AbiGii toxin family protein [Methylomirabilota bacterium]